MQRAIFFKSKDQKRICLPLTLLSHLFLEINNPRPEDYLTWKKSWKVTQPVWNLSPDCIRRRNSIWSKREGEKTSAKRTCISFWVTRNTFFKSCTVALWLREGWDFLSAWAKSCLGNADCCITLHHAQHQQQQQRHGTLTSVLTNVLTHKRGE